MRFDVIYPRDVERIQSEKKAVLIDLRERDAFLRSHISGALNYPLNELKCRENELTGEQYYIFYCEHGGGSAQTAQKYAAKGVRAGSLIGGYEAYRNWRDKDRKK